MQILQTFAGLFSNFGNLTWQMVVMWVIGGLLIYLAIVKKMEPSLLLPMGFGAILVNLPLSGAITQGDTVGPISALFEAGMSNELFPLLLFIGIGAMIDFGPLLEKPWLMLFGAAAQFGIFITLVLAGLFFDLPDAASIAVIGAADGPTAIFVANSLGSKYLGAIMVAAYSYMALVPIVQPPVIKLCTTRKERLIRMPYKKGSVSKTTKILFPIVVTVLAGLVAPASVALVGFLMFGNLLRECGVLNALSETAQNVLANLITIVLGLTAIMVAAYSYMALVPIVQPPVIKLCTTRKERLIRMPYKKGSVSKTTKILFPIVVTVLAGLVAPASVALVGFLMFGNLLRECGVLNALSETAQNVLANLITIVLGLTVAGQMTADKFVQPDTLLILALGLVAFVFDTVGGVLFAKLLNLFLPEGKKINPMIGAAGISAFPMSGRVVNQMGLAEDNQNFLLMYSISVNVSGQIASVIAGGLILTLMNGYV